MAANPKAILDSIAEAITKSLLDAFDASGVVSIFVSGSLAENRIAFFDKGDSVEIYSDIDLSVVLAEGDELDEAREKARALAAGIELDTKSYRLFRRPDVGVYDRRDLLNQPARPGTVGMVLNCRVLFGDDKVLKEIAGFTPEEIQSVEALRLLENRMVELAAAEELLAGRSSEENHRFLYYLSLKLCLDVVSAFLILERNYSPDPEERLERIMKGNIIAEVDLKTDLMEAILLAQDKVNNLQEAMLEDDYDPFIEKAKELSLRSWKEIAKSCLGSNGKANWGELLKRRCCGAPPLANLRQAMIFSRRLHRGRPRGFISWASGFRVTPINALRLSGLADVLGSPGRGGYGDYKAVSWLRNYVDRYTRRLGFDKGAVFSRGRLLYKRLT